jgi:acyl carrier protein
MCRQVQMVLIVLLLGAGGCFIRRDDSTSTVRQIVADQLNVDVEQVRAESTMRDLGYTRAQFVDLVHRLEKDFSTTLSVEEQARPGPNSDSWKSIRVLDLANMVRPEWNKPMGRRKGDSP